MPGDSQNEFKEQSKNDSNKDLTQLSDLVFEPSQPVEQSDGPIDTPLATESEPSPAQPQPQDEFTLSLSPPPAFSDPLPESLAEPDPAPALAPEPQPVSELAATPLAVPLAPPPAIDAPHTLEAVRQFAEGITATQEAAPASDPFTVEVQGQLAPDERARLLDIIAREDIGIREVDLEPQFEAGHILIPRISEFTAVLLVQALRGASAELRLSRQTDEAESHRAPQPGRVQVAQAESTRFAFENIPLTHEAELPEFGPARPLDVVTASATLTSIQVEARGSREFEEIVDNLKRELKARAHRRGAQAIVHFEMQLTPLRDPGLYRLIVSGSAVQGSGPEVERQAPPEPTL